MSNLFRNSRNALTRLSYFGRSSATTATSSGGTAVKSSGASTNLSQASRSADDTDGALRDAAQRGTSSNSSSSGPTGSKSTSGKANTPNTDGSSSNPLVSIGLALVLTAGAYYAYANYIKSPSGAKSTGSNKESSRTSSNTASADQSGSTNKKH